MANKILNTPVSPSAVFGGHYSTRYDGSGNIVGGDNEAIGAFNAYTQNNSQLKLIPPHDKCSNLCSLLGLTGSPRDIGRCLDVIKETLEYDLSSLILLGDWITFDNLDVYPGQLQNTTGRILTSRSEARNGYSVNDFVVAHVNWMNGVNDNGAQSNVVFTSRNMIGFYGADRDNLGGRCYDRMGVFYNEDGMVYTGYADSFIRNNYILGAWYNALTDAGVRSVKRLKRNCSTGTDSFVDIDDPVFIPNYSELLPNLGNYVNVSSEPNCERLDWYKNVSNLKKYYIDNISEGRQWWTASTCKDNAHEGWPFICVMNDLTGKGLFSEDDPESNVIGMPLVTSSPTINSQWYYGFTPTFVIG
jgi:hypothetical protein